MDPIRLVFPVLWLKRGCSAASEPDSIRRYDRRWTTGSAIDLKTWAENEEPGGLVTSVFLSGSRPFLGAISRGEGANLATKSRNSATPTSFFAEAQRIGTSF